LIIPFSGEELKLIEALNVQFTKDEALQNIINRQDSEIKAMKPAYFRFAFVMSRPRKPESFVLEFLTPLNRDAVGASWRPFSSEQLQ
jgi:hypothetical protein